MDSQSESSAAPHALRKYADLLCRMLDAGPGAYSVVDLEGRCMAATTGLAGLAGIRDSASVFEGRLLSERPSSPLQRALQGVALGRPATLEVGRLPFWEGRIGRYEVELVPLSEPGCKTIAAALVALRVLAGGSAADAWFRALAEQAPHGICVLKGGLVLYANPAARQLFGGSDPAELVGRRLRELLESPSAEVEAALSSDLDGRLLRNLEARVLMPSGRTKSVEIEAWKSTVDDNGVTVLLLRPRGPAVVLTQPTAPDGVSADSVAKSVDGPVRASSARTPMVLVCDDEARLAMLTAGLLDQYGYGSLTVSTGMDALKALAAGFPRCDVVLLDLNLPDGNAAEVIGRMRLAGFTQPVILTSGYAEEDVAPELLADPLVAGYLAKPYSVERLVQVIGRALVQVR